MDDHISSTTDVRKYLQEAAESVSPGECREPEPPRITECKHFDMDDILDLAGGALDAIERHQRSGDQITDGENTTSSFPPGKGEEAHAEAKTPLSLLWDLLYWRDTQKTACVFGATLSLLISLSLFSIISVCSYIALALLSVTICFRMYRGVTDALQKHESTHPFKSYLEQDITLTADIIEKHGDMLLKQINSTINKVKHLFLVEDLIDSLKFLVMLWFLTYIGSMFNGLSLLMISDVAVFTCPVLYEQYKAEISHFHGLIHRRFQETVKRIQLKIHGVKTKAE